MGKRIYCDRHKHGAVERCPRCTEEENNSLKSKILSMNNFLERSFRELRIKERIIDYYRETLCVDGHRFAILSECGTAVSPVNTEKLGKLIDERDALRIRVEALEESLKKQHQIGGHSNA